MQIILLHDVDKVGRRGETVNVADGYARNFLFPQGMAVRADTAKTKELEMKLKAFEARDDRDREEAESKATGMQGVALKMSAAASDEGRLFGSVTASMIWATISWSVSRMSSGTMRSSQLAVCLTRLAIPLRPWPSWT